MIAVISAGECEARLFNGALRTVEEIVGHCHRGRLKSKLETLKFSKFLGAAVNGVATFHPVNLPVGLDDPDSVYTAGYRYRPDTSTTNIDDEDAFVVKLSDTP